MAGPLSQDGEARSPNRGYALVLAASVAFATSAPLARIARPAHPMAIAFGRVFLAALVLALWDVRGLARAFRGLTANQRARIALAGALLAAHFGLFQWGLVATSLPAAVSLVSLEPLGVVLCAWLFFGIAPRPLERAGVVIATLGALVVARGAGDGEHRLLGDSLVLGAVALYGFYVVSARGLKDAIAAIHYAPLVYGFAAIALGVLLPFVPTHDEALLWPLPARSLAAIAALALIPTAIGHTLLQTGARTLSPSLIALVSPGETFGSIGLSVLLWQKPPTIEEGLGGAIILIGAGVAVSAQRDDPQRPDRTDR